MTLDPGKRRLRELGERFAAVRAMQEAQAHCAHCAGRGFQLDWTDQGEQMRAVPGDTCRKCDGSGQAHGLIHPVTD